MKRFDLMIFQFKKVKSNTYKMNIKNTCFYLSFLLLSFTSIVAQKSTIKGVVIDNQTLQPIEYASVSLLNQKDNSLVSGVVTSKKGVFNVQNIQNF